MTEIHASKIEQAVCEMCIQANLCLSPDVQDAIHNAAKNERNTLARGIMIDLEANMSAAADMGIPVCQDTGMAVVFAEVGQEVHITGGLLSDAVNRGVARGYTEGYLRCSVVSDPLNRVNTDDNTPAVLHTTLTEGNSIRLTVSPKGFGSENMSRIRMFTPSATREDILEFIVETAQCAGSNPCPPMILGVGIGGDFELCALLSKKALCRSLSRPNPNPMYAEMELEALARINATGIGPQGFGGDTTALGVNIETYPTHIAGLPVAVNMGCYVSRHCTVVLGKR